MAKIRFDDVTVKFRSGLVALDSVNVELPNSGVVALLGPNGAGKSTFLKLIVGAITPSKGTVKIDGAVAGSVIPDSNTLGFALDFNHYPKNERVSRLFDFEVTAHGLNRTYGELARVDFGLESFWNKRLGKLSTGQRQRALIGLAAFHNPDVLLLDEPTNGLDFEALEWLRKFIARRLSDNKLTLIASHNVGELIGLAQDAVLVSQTASYIQGFFSDSPTIDQLRVRYFESIGTQLNPDSDGGV